MANQPSFMTSNSVMSLFPELRLISRLLAMGVHGVAIEQEVGVTFVGKLT